LIDATIKAADELGVAVQCCQKADEAEDPQDRLFFAKKNEDLFAALSGGAASVGGGTAWTNVHLLISPEDPDHLIDQQADHHN
jgi:hypothetical protein